MTSYSIDSNDPIETFINGAARCVLDETEIRDFAGEVIHPDQPTYAEAVWWHSAAFGWEIGAFLPADATRLRERCESFVNANRDDLDRLVDEIVNQPGDFWNTDRGYAWYRAGILFAYSAMGSGVSFLDYTGERLTKDAACRLGRASRTRGLSAWCHDSEYADSSGDTRVRLEEI